MQMHRHTIKLLGDCSFNFNAFLGYSDNTVGGGGACPLLPLASSELKNLHFFPPWYLSLLRFLRQNQVLKANWCRLRCSLHFTSTLHQYQSITFRSLFAPDLENRLERWSSSTYLRTDTFSHRVLTKITSKDFQTISQRFRCLSPTFRSDLGAHFKEI